MGAQEGFERGWWSLWAKSDAQGHPHSLIGHLLDAGAVGELIWDHFLSRRARSQLDAYAAGRGRDLLVLLCAWHDLGKATPAFQAKVPALAARAAAEGFKVPGSHAASGSAPARARQFHGPSGTYIASRTLRRADAKEWDWLLPIIAGHHGAFRQWRVRDYHHEPWQEGPSASAEVWRAAQDGVAEGVAGAFDVSLNDWALKVPPLAVQLALAGLVSMADWIASSDLFPGADLDPLSVIQARGRARDAWTRLGLRGGWRLGPFDPAPFADRFGRDPRPVQQAAIRMVEQMSEPGLLIVEAPMGEGKTELALSAVERLSGRHGFDGFLFAMPTQGTTDAMYERCLRWARAVDPDVPLALLHGKAMANETWRSMTSGVDVRGVCDVGDADYGLESEAEAERAAGVPAAWLLGRHRGLLSPGAIATVDQPLMSATHIKYVALRFAGLLGKVLVIDEVHSYDVFMSQYLQQLLRWCRDLGVPVILMSATLPPAQRAELVQAYAGGLAGVGEVADPGTVDGYPRLTSWCATDGVRVEVAASGRPRQQVRLDILPGDPDDPALVADAALREVVDGGSALVVLNTVRRAQEVYRRVVSSGIETVLLHGRLTTAERSVRTADLVRRLGAESDGRPSLIVVATQIAEQSFDVDADVLITDICPTDLLLQRIGRVHRHAHHDASRPGRLATPRVRVSGVEFRGDDPPTFVRAFERIYDRHSLLRTASLVTSEGQEWSLPAATPTLVAQAYDPAAPWPPGWQGAGELARRSAEERRSVRAGAGRLGLLVPAYGRASLEGLHDRSGAEKFEDRIAVRDGEPSLEVALVRHDGYGYATLAGRPLGLHGERAADLEVAREVLGDTVRVRLDEPLVAEAIPLPQWAGIAMLDRLPAVVLDGAGRYTAAWGVLSYDRETGLSIERNRPHR